MKKDTNVPRMTAPVENDDGAVFRPRSCREELEAILFTAVLMAIAGSILYYRVVIEIDGRRERQSDKLDCTTPVLHQVPSTKCPRWAGSQFMRQVAKTVHPPCKSKCVNRLDDVIKEYYLASEQMESVANLMINDMDLRICPAFFY